MKTIAIFLALLNSLFAGFLILLDLSYNKLHPGAMGWSLLKLTAELSVIVIGVSVWLGAMGWLSPGSVLPGGVLLIALGPATIVWTIHVALTAGDVQYHTAVFGAGLAVQGIASLLGFGVATQSMTIS